MTTLTLHSPGELIATLPSLLDPDLHGAVVVVGLSDAGGLEIVLRAIDDDAGRGFGMVDVSDVVTALAHADVSRVILIDWTYDDEGSGTTTLRRVVEALEPHCEVADLWMTDGNTYRLLGCEGQGCCPEGGLPVPPSHVRPRTAIAPARASAAPVPARRRANASRAARRWESTAIEGRAQWCRQTWIHVTDSMATAVPDATWGKVIAGLRDVRVRDALIVHWLGASDEVVDDVLFGNVTARVDAAMDTALRPGSSEAPAPEILADFLEWCATLAGMCTKRDKAQARTLTALLYWWAGDAFECQSWALSALAADPAYTLAMLLCDMCDAGLTPGWQRG